MSARNKRAASPAASEEPPTKVQKKWWNDVDGIPALIEGAQDLVFLTAWLQSALEQIEELHTEARECAAGTAIPVAGRPDRVARLSRIACFYWCQNGAELTSIETSCGVDDASIDRYSSTNLLFCVVCLGMLAVRLYETQLTGDERWMDVTVRDLPAVWRRRVGVSSLPICEYSASVLTCAMDSLSVSWCDKRIVLELFEYVDMLCVRSGMLLRGSCPAQELDVPLYRVARALAGNKSAVVYLASRRFISELSARFHALYMTRYALLLCKADKEPDIPLTDAQEQRARVCKQAIPEFAEFLANYCTNGIGRETVRERFTQLCLLGGVSPGDRGVYNARRPYDDARDTSTVLRGIRGSRYCAKLDGQIALSTGSHLSTAALRTQALSSARPREEPHLDLPQPREVDPSHSPGRLKAITLRAPGDGAVSAPVPDDSKTVTLAPGDDDGTFIFSSEDSRSSMTLIEEAACLAALDCLLMSGSDMRWLENYVLSKERICTTFSEIEHDVPVICSPGNCFEVCYGGKCYPSSCVLESILLWFALVPDDGHIPSVPTREAKLQCAAGIANKMDLGSAFLVARACINAATGAVARGTWKSYFAGRRSCDTNGAAANVVVAASCRQQEAQSAPRWRVAIDPTTVTTSSKT